MYPALNSGNLSNSFSKKTQRNGQTKRKYDMNTKYYKLNHSHSIPYRASQQQPYFLVINSERNI